MGSRPGRSDPRRRAPERGEDVELYGLHPVREALRARRRPLRRLRLRKGDRRPQVAELLQLARQLSLPVDEVSAEELTQTLPPGSVHQGVALRAGPLPEMTVEALAQLAPQGATLVALDGVEDPQNVGAIARVAEAAGARGLVLTRHRAPPLGPAAARASAGAIEWIPVARVPNLARALAELQRAGFWTFACDPEEGEDLFSLPAATTAGARVVVLGAEGRGLREGLRRVLDHRLRIPMGGRVASLNVAAAAAVVLFELARRDRLAPSGSAGDLPRGPR